MPGIYVPEISTKTLYQYLLTLINTRISKYLSFPFVAFLFKYLAIQIFTTQNKFVDIEESVPVTTLGKSTLHLGAKDFRIIRIKFARSF